MKRLKQRVLPILGGRPAFPFPEGGAEGGLGGKAAVQSDALDGEAGGRQQEAGRTDPGGEQILVRRKACCLRKNAKKMKGADPGFRGEQLQRNRFAEMFIDVGNAVRNGIFFGALFFRFFPGKKQVKQPDQLCGQNGFAGCGRRELRISSRRPKTPEEGVRILPCRAVISWS